MEEVAHARPEESQALAPAAKLRHRSARGAFFGNHPAQNFVAPDRQIVILCRITSSEENWPVPCDHPVRFAALIGFEYHNVADPDPGGIGRVDVQNVPVSDPRQHAPASRLEAETHAAGNQIASQRREKVRPRA